MNFDTLISFWTNHHAAATAIAMGAVHFAHLGWPKFKIAWSCWRANGGLKGMWSLFLRGNPESPKT